MIEPFARSNKKIMIVIFFLVSDVCPLLNNHIVHAILSYKHHPYKHQYYNFEKLRTTSTKLSENKDHNTWQTRLFSKSARARLNIFSIFHANLRPRCRFFSFSSEFTISVRFSFKKQDHSIRNIAKIKDHIRTIGTKILGKYRDH